MKDNLVSERRSNYMTAFLGKSITLLVDRPLGTSHPNFPDLIYPVNYGFVPDTRTGDGEEVDAYVLGVDAPLKRFAGQCIAVIHRLDDVEGKLVVAPPGTSFTAEEIKVATQFQERYFDDITPTFN